MKTVNRVTLLGNVGRDPESKVLGSGTVVSEFSLATSERFKDTGGQWQDRAEWHNLIAYGRLAEVVRDYVRKGSKLYVEGRLQTRSWEDRDGHTRYRTEIVAQDVVLLDGRGEQREVQPEPFAGPFAGAVSDVTDEDIPF